jgi:sulfoacetaldehyde acetyltransferase
MYALAEADVVVALGTRLGPFGTNPQYGIDYWPKNAKLIQVDANPRHLGLTREANVAIHGDAGAAARELLSLLQQKQAEGGVACLGRASLEHRKSHIQNLKSNWANVLQQMTDATPHSTVGKIKPRAALRELQKAMPANVMVTTDIGNTCSVANSYLNFETPGSFFAAMTFGNCGYSFPTAIGAKYGAPHRPVVAYAGDGAWAMSFGEVLTCVRENIPTTAVVFNNGQWGAEKKNQVLWFGDRYVGSQLKNPSFAEVARSMGGEGIRVESESEVGDALRKAIDLQMNEGKTCVIEIMTSKELGDPFRRDAMKLPRRVLPKYAPTTMFSESATGQPTDL